MPPLTWGASVTAVHIGDTHGRKALTSENAVRRCGIPKTMIHCCIYVCFYLSLSYSLSLSLSLSLSFALSLLCSLSLSLSLSVNPPPPPLSRTRAQDAELTPRRETSMSYRDICAAPSPRRYPTSSTSTNCHSVAHPPPPSSPPGRLPFFDGRPKTMAAAYSNAAAASLPSPMASAYTNAPLTDDTVSHPAPAADQPLQRPLQPAHSEPEDTLTSPGVRGSMHLPDPSRSLRYESEAASAGFRLPSYVTDKTGAADARALRGCDLTPRGLTHVSEVPCVASAF